MSNQRVLVTDHIFSDMSIEKGILEPIGLEVVLADDPSPEALVQSVAGARGLLVCFAPVGKEVVEAAAEQGCKVISRYGIGYDNVDVETATAHGIVVTNVPDYCIEEVADHAMAMLLGLARNTYYADRQVRAGDWTVPHGTVNRLRGRRLAVLGTGHIGRCVIDRALAFGIEVVAYDPYLKEWDIPAERAETFEEAIKNADMISLHTPLTEQTHHLLNAEAFAQMENSPIVVNTSRGGLIDTRAAATALEQGQISAIGLDVTETEPLEDDHPLRDQPRAVITPHMGFYSIQAEAELQTRAAQAVADVLNGERPRNPVNPEVLS